MKNKIEDMRDHMFAQLERLNDESLTGEALEAEINRAKAVGEVCQALIGSAKVEVDFIKVTGRNTVSAFLEPNPVRPLIEQARG